MRGLCCCLALSRVGSGFVSEQNLSSMRWMSRSRCGMCLGSVVSVCLPEIGEARRTIRTALVARGLRLLVWKNPAWNISLDITWWLNVEVRKFVIVVCIHCDDGGSHVPFTDCCSTEVDCKVAVDVHALLSMT